VRDRKRTRGGLSREEGGREERGGESEEEERAERTMRVNHEREE
jgi:hypothetical protein